MFKLNFPDTSAKEFNLAATVAKVVELTDLKMVDGEFGPTPQVEKKAKSKSKDVPYEFGFRSRFDEKENRLEAMITIEGRDIRNATGEGAGGTGLRVKATFLLTYQVMVEPPPKDVREAFFTAFAQVNGLMNIWPYYREFAHEAARRLGVPNVIVPLLRVEPKPEPKAPRGPVKERNPKALSTKRVSKG